MIELLADVGGTNTRFALARGGTLDSASLRRFANDAHDGIVAVLDRYLDAMGGPRPEALCLAVAGPVGAGKALLTNRDWVIDADELARRTGAERVRMINDLTALGHAVPALGGDGLLSVAMPTPSSDLSNGQSLVLGLGTGVNACAVRDLGPAGCVCLEAEAGHAALPAPVADALRQRLGEAAAAAFATVEDLFSGRGLSALDAAMRGSDARPGRAIVEAARAGEGAAGETVAVFGRLLGLYVRDLCLIYLPRDGLYLAGSVARGVIEAGGAAPFRAARAEPRGRYDGIVQSIAVRVIADDMAPLTGCLRALRAAG